MSKGLYSSAMWRKLRKEILDQDKHCAVCGSIDTLDVHHKKRYKEGGENTRENLIALCQSHHQKIHTLEMFYRNNYAPRDFNRLLNEVRIKHQKSLKPGVIV